jgi:hypothetical protein
MFHDMFLLWVIREIVIGQGAPAIDARCGFVCSIYERVSLSNEELEKVDKLEGNGFLLQVCKFESCFVI